ncbi:hypothetical protein AA313_de0204364 [Arthrobotrys entomopaga]|nr:hypothetical protein AA313_de0204364 [Arthrobotrys entomopaga]
MVKLNRGAIVERVESPGRYAFPPSTPNSLVDMEPVTGVPQRETKTIPTFPSYPWVSTSFGNGNRRRPCKSLKVSTKGDERRKKQSHSHMAPIATFEKQFNFFAHSAIAKQSKPYVGARSFERR